MADRQRARGQQDGRDRTHRQHRHDVLSSQVVAPSSSDTEDERYRRDRVTPPRSELSPYYDCEHAVVWL